MRFAYDSSNESIMICSGRVHRYGIETNWPGWTSGTKVAIILDLWPVS